jgi:hypothetical protein
MTTRAVLLNSGTDGLGEADDVGLAVAGVPDASDSTETVLSAALVTNISFLPES